MKVVKHVELPRMHADIASAIRLGVCGWVVFQNRVHFWDDGMPSPPCTTDSFTSARAIDVTAWLGTNIVADDRAPDGTKVGDVINLAQLICPICAEVWRGD